MGIVKSEAQRRVNRLQRERAVAASDMDAIRSETGGMVCADAGVCVHVTVPRREIQEVGN